MNQSEAISRVEQAAKAAGSKGITKRAAVEAAGPELKRSVSILSCMIATGRLRDNGKGRVFFVPVATN